MECEEISALLGAFVDDELPIELIARVNAHLSSCLACQNARDSLMLVRSKMQDFKSKIEPEEGFLERLKQNVELKRGSASSSRRIAPVSYLVLPLAVAATFALFFFTRTDETNSGRLSQTLLLTAPDLYSYEYDIRNSGIKPTEFNAELASSLTGAQPAAPHFEGWQLKRTSVVSVKSAKAIKYSYKQVDNGKLKTFECYQFPAGQIDASALSHHVIDGRSICCGTKGKVSLVYWKQANKDFVLASEMPREDLLSIALDS